MNPLSYCCGVLLFALGTYEVAAEIRAVDVNRVEYSGHLMGYGPGFIAYIPDKNRFVYAETEESYSRELRQNLTDTNARKSQEMKVLNEYIDSFRIKSKRPRPGVFYVGDFVNYKVTKGRDSSSPAIMDVQCKDDTRVKVTFPNLGNLTYVKEVLDARGVKQLK